MPEAIYLEDALIARLRASASARNVSPQELAQQVLTSHLDRLETAAASPRLNDRRLALIEQNSKGKLTAAEREELERLQTAADRWYEDRDQQLLEELRRCRQVVERFPEEANSGMPTGLCSM